MFILSPFLRTTSIMLMAIDHGDAKLSELSGEVEVTLKVRAVDDVEYRIGTLAYQVVTGDDFLKRVRGQGVDTGKVHDDDVVVLLELAFLLSRR